MNKFKPGNNDQISDVKIDVTKTTDVSEIQGVSPLIHINNK